MERRKPRQRKIEPKTVFLARLIEMIEIVQRFSPFSRRRSHTGKRVFNRRVGAEVSLRSPHQTVRADFPHTAFRGLHRLRFQPAVVGKG